MLDTTTTERNDASKYSVIRQFIRWTLLSWFCLTILLWVGKNVYDQSLKDQTLQRHSHLMRSAQTLIHEHLLRVIQDIHQLGSIPAVQDFLDQPSPDTRKKLEKTLILTSNVYGRYDQIRLLDLKGKEVLRINQNTTTAYAVSEA
ncbi:MAG: hypothetical protein WBM99_09000, partial [Psychromonas sp.]